MSPRLGRYRLVRKLAIGGMAEVLLATAEGPGGFEKEVVLKRLHPHLVADPYFTRMFFAEAQLAARLDHPNVVQVFDFGTAPSGEHFLAMEYVDGLTLRTIVKRFHEGGL